MIAPITAITAAPTPMPMPATAACESPLEAEPSAAVADGLALSAVLELVDDEDDVGTVPAVEGSADLVAEAAPPSLGRSDATELADVLGAIAMLLVDVDGTSTDVVGNADVVGAGLVDATVVAAGDADVVLGGDPVVGLASCWFLQKSPTR